MQLPSVFYYLVNYKTRAFIHKRSPREQQLNLVDKKQKKEYNYLNIIKFLSNKIT